MKSILAAAALAVATVSGNTSLAVADSQDFVAELARVKDFVAPDARGQAKFQLSADGSDLRFEVTVENLKDFAQAHIHVTNDALIQDSVLGRFRAPSSDDAHGPIVAFLTKFTRKGVAVDGVLAEGVITKADLVGPLNGYPLALLVELMNRGDAYVAVHVLEPIPPDKKFCCPLGMRGVIKASRSQ